MIEKTDVVVIGGGVAGTAIARELSKYNVKAILVERNGSICAGQSKATIGWVHGNIALFIMYRKDYRQELKGITVKIATDGFKLFDQLASQLDIPYIRTGSLIMTINDKHVSDVEHFRIVSEELGSKLVELDKDDALTLEPNITKKYVFGVYEAPYDKIVFPPDLVIALAESADKNGVKLLQNTEVRGISEKNGLQVVETNRGSIMTRFIVNAAGTNADKVADMADARDGWENVLFRNQIFVLDKRNEGLTRNIIMQWPENYVVMPHVNGTPLIACNNYYPTSVENRDDTRTKIEWFHENIVNAQTLIPTFSPKEIIKSYGTVSLGNKEHIIEASKKNPSVINAVVKAPGMSSALAIAPMVIDILAKQGLKLMKKTDFDPYRTRIPRFHDLSDNERRTLIAKNPRYGHVVCRCEHVTEGEIIEAIKRGARTVDGVKFRVHAGLGRCQGGFCGPRVVGILAKELNIPVTSITKKGGNSNILYHETKELLKQG